MGSPVIQVEHLSIASSAGLIIQDLSFEIHKKEIVALSGLSGSGKSTIANALLNMLPAGLHITAGKIKLDLKDDKVYQLPGDEAVWSRLRGNRIGFMQQDVYGAFDPVLRIGRQLVMIIAERTSKQKDKIDIELRAAMLSLGIPQVDRIFNSYPHQLSGGQLQRCLLSMLSVMMPEVIIVDEPTSAVDRINQQELLNSLRLAKEKYGIAILCITHDRQVVKRIADREIQLTAPYTKTKISNVRHEDTATQNHPILALDQISYTHNFGGLFSRKGGSIQDIDLEVRQGSCIGIIGESGSGKSTIAQLMVGLLKPNRGEITLQGKVLNYDESEDIQNLRCQVQLVMQDGRGSLHPDKTIRYLLSEVVSPNKKTDPADVEEKIIQAITEVNLPSIVLDKYPSQLSGGECFRISLARALLKSPNVLICDESTSALDEENTSDILNLLNKLKNDHGLALLLISHDPGVILRMADEIVVIANGSVIERGKTEELIRESRHPMTIKMLSEAASI